MIEDQFIPHELAVIAKEKEFNEPCLAYYSYVQEKVLRISECATYVGIENCYKAPTYYQIINWLDKKGIIISIQYAAPDTNQFRHRIDCYTDELSITTHSNDFFDTRKECLIHAIECAFKLI